MKFILFDVQDVNKANVSKIALNANYYVNELTFSKRVLDTMNNEPKNILEKIKYKVYDKKIERIILNALENYNKKWYYILSKDMVVNNKYLTNKFEQLLGYKLPIANEMASNIYKHIDEYVNKNKQMKLHELKVLLVVTNSKNLNITLLSNLIKEYKDVNIYLKERPSEYILKRIRQINQNEGTTIEILKKERKSFVEYDVIYFVDDFRENYPRFRLNKNVKIIDLEEIKRDKYNSNIIYLNEFINKQDVNIENIQNLRTKYNYLELAQMVNKITNVLDKS